MTIYFKLALLSQLSLSWVVGLTAGASSTCSAGSNGNCQAEGVSLIQRNGHRARAQHTQEDQDAEELDEQTQKVREEFRRLNRTALRLNLTKQLNEEGTFKVYSHDFEVTGFSQSEEASVGLSGDLPEPDLTVQAFSSHPSGTPASSGTVVFLHGAGGSAEEYVDMYQDGLVNLPSDYKLIWLQSPRQSLTKTPWMAWIDSHKEPWESDNYWNPYQIDANFIFLKKILYTVQKEAGGYGKVWIAGKSQGGVMSIAHALMGTTGVLAGAFAICAYPAPQIYANNKPVTPADALKPDKKASKMKIGFYTGSKDTSLPYDEAFPRFKEVLRKTWGFPSPTYFWIADGYTHSSISPSSDGNEWTALWWFVQGKPWKIDGKRWYK